jgi:MFS family permease
MVYIAIGVALLLWGALVGRVGRKLGTLLAILPVLVWGGVLAWFTWSGATDRSTGDALPAYLLVGLFAFLIGVNLTTRREPSDRARQG